MPVVEENRPWFNRDPLARAVEFQVNLRQKERIMSAHGKLSRKLNKVGEVREVGTGRSEKVGRVLR